MVDRPYPADPKWLQTVGDTYGECRLVLITTAGERGLACQMQINADSLPYLRQFPCEMSDNIKMTLYPLLEEPPAPVLKLDWDEEKHL